MQAWQITELGEPAQVLQLQDKTLPAVGAGEVRIRVAAAGVGLPDVLMCRGHYEFKPEFPFTPGQEMVGTVLEVGEGVSFAPGDRVMGVTSFFNGHGGFAQECMSTESMLFPAPLDMPDHHAAGFVIPYHTAWLGLVDRAGIRAGETLLVLGAAGGSGSAALQVGKALGAKVIAVAGGGDKLHYCKELGADITLDHRTEDVVSRTNEITDGRGADVVFDPVGGELCAQVVSCTAKEGRLLLIGFASGKWGRIPTHQVVIRNCSIMGVFVGAYSGPQRTAVNKELLQLYQQGKIQPPVGEQLAFADVPAALVELEARTALGKLVVKVEGDSV